MSIALMLNQAEMRAPRGAAAAAPGVAAASDPEWRSSVDEMRGALRSLQRDGAVLRDEMAKIREGQAELAANVAQGSALMRELLDKARAFGGLIAGEVA